MNRLYYGDCLTIMRDKMKLASVDLIYLDPPFNSNREYNAIYKDETGRPLPDQIEAFCDMWTLDEERERSIRHMPILMRESGIDDGVVTFWQTWMNALRNTRPRLLAYLSYMVERLIYMRPILKPTGTLYLHCDPTASHYIKVMLDGVFGHKNFRNEIVWRRTNAKGLATKRLASNHDVILFYGKDAKVSWNPPHEAHDPDYVEKFYRHVEDDTGRRYTLGDLTNPNKNRPNLEYEFLGVRRVWRWTNERMQRAYEEGLVVQSSEGAVPRLKRYLDEQKGRAIDDIWSDIAPVSPRSEGLGYATQKPLALLERIIKASSNEGDVVFDPFCGCATTMEAAQRLNRRWIGIDIAIHAIKRVARIRLGDRCKLVEGHDYTIDGVPKNLEGSRDLWKRDKYHFQKWAVEQVDGFVTTKRTADGGIDGRLYFAVPEKPDLQSMAIEVKGGKNVSIADVRALRGVLDNDQALMAGLIVMDRPGTVKERNFKRFMADAGDLSVMSMQYPRMQLLTVEEILEGVRFVTPSVAGRGTGQENLPLSG